MKLLAIALGMAFIVVPAGVRAQEVGNVESGRTYAIQNCAGCHAVDAEATHSPTPKAPPFQEISETPGMNGRALAVWLRSTHKDMPDFIIERGDMEDVIAYILSLNRGPQTSR